MIGAVPVDRRAVEVVCFAVKEQMVEILRMIGSGIHLEAGEIGEENRSAFEFGVVLCGSCKISGRGFAEAVLIEAINDAVLARADDQLQIGKKDGSARAQVLVVPGTPVVGVASDAAGKADTANHTAFISERREPVHNIELGGRAGGGRSVVQLDEAFGKVGFTVPASVASHEIDVALPVAAGPLRGLPDASTTGMSLLRGNEAGHEFEGLQIEGQQPAVNFRMILGDAATCHEKSFAICTVGIFDGIEEESGALLLQWCNKGKFLAGVRGEV